MVMINKFVVSLIMIFILFISSSTAYTIDEDLVYFDDAYVYLSTYPHTINSSGWVYFNFTSKVYTGDVDFCLGYDSEVVKPKEHELYNPHWVNWTTNHQSYFYNVSSITQYNGDDFDFGNSYNTYQRQIIYDQCINHSEFECTEYTQAIANCSFDSYTQDGTNYTIYWHTKHSRYELYSPFPQKPSHVSCNVQGMTDWYYIQNVPITQNQNYQMRVWVEVPVSLDPISSKYFFAIKPSGETISQAISNGHFYYLDPWYNAQWGKRKLITVDHVNATGDTLLNFPAYINVSKEIEMQADYDDVVFVNSTTDLIMDYELENSTATHAIYWVNITHLTSPNATFWMYYDNAGATSQEDPEGVWDLNTIMVHHFQDLNDSTSYNNDATNHGSTYNSTWLLDGERDFDGIDDHVDCGNDESLNITDVIMIETWIKPNTITNTYSDIIRKRSDWFIEVTTDAEKHFRTSVYNDSASEFTLHAGAFTYDTWNHVVLLVDTDTNEMKTYHNGSLYDSRNDFTGLIQTSELELTIGAASQWSGFFNGTIDEVRISNISRSPDYINQSYQMVINQSTFVTFGSDETPDTTFTVTLPAGHVYVKFEPNNSTHKNCTPNGQTSSIPFYNVTNTGNIPLDIRMKLNATVTNIDLKVDDDNNPSGATTITISLQTIKSNLAVDASADIWLWSDFNHAIQQDTNKTLTINVTE